VREPQARDSLVADGDRLSPPTVDVVVDLEVSGDRPVTVAVAGPGVDDVGPLPVAARTASSVVSGSAAHALPRGLGICSERTQLAPPGRSPAFSMRFRTLRLKDSCRVTSCLL
jgi:hypothetical protein